MQKMKLVLVVVVRCAFSARSEQEAVQLVVQELKFWGSEYVRVVADFDAKDRVICVEEPDVGWVKYVRMSSDTDVELRSHYPCHQRVAA